MAITIHMSTQKKRERGVLSFSAVLYVQLKITGFNVSESFYKTLLLKYETAAHLLLLLFSPIPISVSHKGPEKKSKRTEVESRSQREEGKKGKYRER